MTFVRRVAPADERDHLTIAPPSTEVGDPLPASYPSTQTPVAQSRDTSDDLAKVRTRLAAERTLMAWVRTSLAMIGFGFGIDRIVESIRSSEVTFIIRLESSVRWFGVGMVLLGIYAMWASLREYRHTLSTIGAGTSAHDSGRSVALNVARWMIVVGWFAFASLLWSLFSNR